MRATNFLGGARAAGATVITLCVAWCGTSCSPAAGRVPSSPGLAGTPCPTPGAAGHGAAVAGRGAARIARSSTNRVVPAAPARQVWASTLRGGTASAEALSPDGTRLFVLGYAGSDARSETVAYSAATGARLWAKAYLPNSGGPDKAIAVSPDGARVYVTGYKIGLGSFTVAYAAGTGRQLWVSRYNQRGAGLGGLAVSPDGRTVYESGRGGSQSYIALIAYDAATGKQRWLRYYTRVKSAWAGSVAVSPDGSTVYVAGGATVRVAGGAGAAFHYVSSLIVLAYDAAAGTLKWATWYANRYTGGAYAGGAFGGPIVLGPGGSDLYVAGTVSSKAGHHVAATFAFRAATGKCLWLDPDSARGGGGRAGHRPARGHGVRRRPRRGRL